MKLFPYPEKLGNWCDGKIAAPAAGAWFEKVNPHDGSPICQAARSTAKDVDVAVTSAHKAQTAWGELPVVKRGEVLYQIVDAFRTHDKELAKLIALETGKSPKDALAEVGGAIALGRFYAGEGQRFYGRTTTSATPNRQAMTVREPVGVAGLIVAANTPIANITWKLFPALICGNAAVLKASEDAPLTAWAIAALAHEAGLAPGLFNIIQGLGEEAGAPIVAHRQVDLISFTGSTAVGRYIAEVAGKRLARISLELGGKNPFVICDDADLEQAAHWAALSAFSNAGQRCASGSRLIIFDSVYDKFRELIVKRAKALRVGPMDDDDLGPVINEKQLIYLLDALTKVKSSGAKILCGGERISDDAHHKGFYLAPTVVEGAGPHDEFSQTELFGPITSLYRTKDLDGAVTLANNSPYGLTACIHTKNINRAQIFTRRVNAGVVMVNAGTYGSEPHMPFGGVKQSGNGTREPGTEALEIYSNLKDVYILTDPRSV